MSTMRMATVWKHPMSPGQYKAHLEEMKKKMVPIRPTKDRLLLKPITPADKVGLIYLPDNKNSKLKQNYVAEVVAVGPATSEEAGYERAVKVGDRVLLSDIAGDRVEIVPGEKWVIVRERDITGIVEEGDVSLSSEESNDPFDRQTEEDERAAQATFEMVRRVEKERSHQNEN